MEFNWLEDLIALARAMNFSRAAEARNVTQPAFSRRIRAFEDWVGEPLVDRSSHRIVLTPAGEVMLQVAADMLRDLENGRRGAREAMSRRPTLRFASTHALSLTVFPGMLMALEPAAAAMPIRLYADNMVACERMMGEGQVEFLLCHHHPAAPTRLSPREFSWIEVGTDRLFPVCRRDADGRPAFARPSPDANPTPLLAFDDRSGMGRIIQAAAPEGMANTVPIFTSHLAIALKAMTLEGKGVAWLPMSLVREELGLGGRLVRVGADELEIAVAIVVLRPNRKLGPEAEGLWQLLRRRVRVPEGVLPAAQSSDR